MLRSIVAIALLPLLGLAQEVSSVASPDGQLVFVLDVAQPPIDESALPGLAYQVRYQGKLLMDTSFLGFDVWNQEPMLGEKVGLSLAKNTQERGYNSLYAEYLQQGSLGRRLNMEVRAYNNGIAFRYIVPPSPPMMEIFFRDEITEFRFSAARRLSAVPESTVLQPPFAVEVPGIAWVSVQQADAEKLFTLRHYEGNSLVLRLPRLAEDPTFVVKSHPTWTSPWRALLVGPSEASVRSADFLDQLPKR